MDSSFKIWGCVGGLTFLSVVLISMVQVSEGRAILKIAETNTANLENYHEAETMRLSEKGVGDGALNAIAAQHKSGTETPSGSGSELGSEDKPHGLQQSNSNRKGSTASKPNDSDPNEEHGDNSVGDEQKNGDAGTRSDSGTHDQKKGSSENENPDIPDPKDSELKDPSGPDEVETAPRSHNQNHNQDPNYASGSHSVGNSKQGENEDVGGEDQTNSSGQGSSNENTEQRRDPDDPIVPGNDPDQSTTGDGDGDGDGNGNSEDEDEPDNEKSNAKQVQSQSASKNNQQMPTNPHRPNQHSSVGPFKGTNNSGQQQQQSQTEDPQDEMSGNKPREKQEDGNSNDDGNEEQQPENGEQENQAGNQDNNNEPKRTENSHTQQKQVAHNNPGSHQPHQ